MTVRRPAQLDAGSLLRLFSPGTWAAVAGSTVVVAVLLARTLKRSSVGAEVTSLALLLGQSVPLGVGRLPPRHRPLVAVWLAMSLILTTAYLSDLTKTLTIPDDQPPRTAKDLVDQRYQLLSEYENLKPLYSHVLSPYVRQLARTMRISRSRQEVVNALLNDRFAYTLDPRTCMRSPSTPCAAQTALYSSRTSTLAMKFSCACLSFAFGPSTTRSHPFTSSRASTGPQVVCHMTAVYRTSALPRSPHQVARLRPALALLLHWSRGAAAQPGQPAWAADSVRSWSRTGAAGAAY